MYRFAVRISTNYATRESGILDNCFYLQLVCFYKSTFLNDSASIFNYISYFNERILSLTQNSFDLKDFWFAWTWKKWKRTFI